MGEWVVFQDLALVSMAPRRVQQGRLIDLTGLGVRAGRLHAA